MKRIFTLLFLFSNFSYAQDIIRSTEGDIKIQPILHGTLVLNFDDVVVYVDPYGGASAFEGQPNADYVLITDIHGDHHNQETLDGLDLDNASIIAPKAVTEKLPQENYKSVISLANGGSWKMGEINISTIPMYNLPETEDSRHPKGRGNGYILTFGDKKIYISGDTEDIPEMRSLKNIDIAFVCMNLPYTMSVNQAAIAVSEFGPDIVYPYHYRGPDGLSDVESFKTMVNERNANVEVRLRNWYPSN